VKIINKKCDTMKTIKLINGYFKGLNVSEMDTRAMRNHNANKKTSERKNMVCGKLLANRDTKKRKIIKTDIPYFFRYAIAFSQ
jgi:hypothetical protein